MSKLTLYREGAAKIPFAAQRSSGNGYSRAFRSMRASWTRVFVQIDGLAWIRLRQSAPDPVELSPGPHTVNVSGPGFAPDSRVIQVDDDSELIVAITPEWRQEVTSSNPLGQLRIRPVDGPGALQPYQFYKKLPTSYGHSGVLLSVFYSLVMSVVSLGLGLASLVATALVWSRTFLGGLFCLVCASFIAPIFVPAGLGGIVVAVRFLRLPKGWRSPHADSSANI